MKGYLLMQTPDQPIVAKNSKPPDSDADLQRVVLAKGTFFKFAVTIAGTVVLGMSGVLAFYWNHHYRVASHMENKSIHLSSGERAKLETKAEAQQHREKLVKEVRREVEYSHRELKLGQGEQIQKSMKKLTVELKEAQLSELRKILQEVKQTRKAVDKSHE